MARFIDREKARTLRKKGLSYSAIKNALGVSKSTLSGWLSDMPLSRDQINALRAHSPRRIERFRHTMSQKREQRILGVQKNVEKSLGSFSKRELLVAGFFLYWGEGGKTRQYGATLANTDPSMIRFYLHWLQILNVPQSKIKVRLQLYSDMNIDREVRFWSRELKISSEHFTKPYIKQSRLNGLTYRGFGHGTCNIIVDSRDVSEYIKEALIVIQKRFL